MNMLLILSVLISTLSLAQQQPKTKIKEEELLQCYNQFPIIQSLIMMISDQDFSSPSESEKRKKLIQSTYVKKPNELRSCYEKVVTFAKDQNDPENTKHVVTRLKEVSTIVNANPTSKKGLKGTP